MSSELELKREECDNCGIFVYFSVWIIDYETKKKRIVCEGCAHRIRNKNMEWEG